MEEAKSRLRIQDITGVRNKWRECLGMRVKREREMIVNEIKKKGKDTRIIQMAQLAKQGQKMKWEVPQR